MRVTGVGGPQLGCARDGTGASWQCQAANGEEHAFFTGIAVFWYTSLTLCHGWPPDGLLINCGFMREGRLVLCAHCCSMWGLSASSLC